MGLLLQKVTVDKPELMVVALLWTTRPWFPQAVYAKKHTTSTSKRMPKVTQYAVSDSSTGQEVDTHGHDTIWKSLDLQGLSEMLPISPRLLEGDNSSTL